MTIATWPGRALVALVTLVWIAGPVLAQAGTGGAASATDISYFEFFVVKGGWIAYLLIALSVVALALTIEHALTIRRSTVAPPSAAEHARMLISQRRYLEAIQYTAGHPSLLGGVLHAALSHAPQGFSEMERAAEETLDDRAARLSRKIEYLNIIGGVAPMIGLFGTVVGMILLFADIHAANNFPSAQIVADRIALALITTFWGLAVAIPSLAVYGIFRNRIEVLTSECLLSADDVLALFKPGGVPLADPASSVVAAVRVSRPGEVPLGAPSSAGRPAAQEGVAAPVARVEAPGASALRPAETASPAGFPAAR